MFNFCLLYWYHFLYGYKSRAFDLFLFGNEQIIRLLCFLNCCVSLCSFLAIISRIDFPFGPAKSANMLELTVFKNFLLHVFGNWRKIQLAYMGKRVHRGLLRYFLKSEKERREGHVENFPSLVQGCHCLIDSIEAYPVCYSYSFL